MVIGLNANLVVLHHGRIHEGLTASDVSGFEGIYLVANPLCPDFGLSNTLVHSEGMLNPLGVG
jgi:hypothetical protein